MIIIIKSIKNKNEYFYNNLKQSLVNVKKYIPLVLVLCRLLVS